MGNTQFRQIIYFRNNFRDTGFQLANAGGLEDNTPAFNQIRGSVANALSIS